MSASAAPVAIGYTTRNLGARINGRAASAPCNLAHRELVVSTINGSTTWTLAPIGFSNLNPGLSAPFPWASATAANFQQYVIRKCRLIYVPIASAITQGDVIFTPLYDATGGPPLTEQAAISVKNSVTCPVWKETVIPLDVPAMNSGIARKWIRVGPVAAIGNDLKTYDFAQIYISTNNCASSAPIGKLFIEYDFVLFDQVTDKGVQNQTFQNVVVFQDGVGDAANFGTVTALGTYPVFMTENCTPQSANALGITSSGPGEFTFANAGVFRVEFLSSLGDNGAAVYTYKADVGLNGVLPANDTTGRLISKGAYSQNFGSSLLLLNTGTQAFVVMRAGDKLNAWWRLTTLTSGTPAAGYTGGGTTNPLYTSCMQITFEQIA